MGGSVYWKERLGVKLKFGSKGGGWGSEEGSDPERPTASVLTEPLCVAIDHEAYVV
jgi:hypothetical protein